MDEDSDGRSTPTQGDPLVPSDWTHLHKGLLPGRGSPGERPLEYPVTMSKQGREPNGPKIFRSTFADSPMVRLLRRSPSTLYDKTLKVQSSVSLGTVGHTDSNSLQGGEDGTVTVGWTVVLCIDGGQTFREGYITARYPSIGTTDRGSLGR